MRLVLTIAAVLIGASGALAQADDDVLKAARECADRSVECRMYVERSQREDAVLATLQSLGRAIGLQYNCDGNEAAAMEMRAKREYKAAMPNRSADIDAAIDRGVASVASGACRALDVRQAMQRYSDQTASIRR